MAIVIMAIVIVAPILSLIITTLIPVAIPITRVGVVGGKGTHAGEHPAAHARLGCWDTDGRKRYRSH
jgi:hypothetical protein